jgi:hypothetical protein
MSDKLVVEFAGEDKQIIAVVFALHGGDNPPAAALTIADFLNQIAKLDEPRFNDAGLLAARFVVWQSGISKGPGELAFHDVVLIPRADDYGYQLARVYAQDDRPYVHIVRDKYSTWDELTDAATLLGQRNVDEPTTI